MSGSYEDQVHCSSVELPYYYRPRVMFPMFMTPQGIDAFYNLFLAYTCLLKGDLMQRKQQPIWDLAVDRRFNGRLGSTNM